MKKLILLVFIVGIGKINAQFISTVAGGGTCSDPYFCGDGGSALEAKITNAVGVATDRLGNIYLIDSYNCRIRKVDRSGIITTIAGCGTRGFSGDGGPATAAQLYFPQGITLDTAGNIYIADTGNNRVRKVNTSGIITTVAGNGAFTYFGDGGPATAAGLYRPTGVTFDIKGNLYIADRDNDRVRKVDASGTITTVAGGGSVYGDGRQATLTLLYGPQNLCVDVTGNLYFAEAGGNRVRKVDTSGVISTIAGTGISGFSGDGGLATSAELNDPTDVILDDTGNIYIVDEVNNRIRKINTSGIISTIAGNGAKGFSGDGGLAINAELDFPYGIAFGPSGDLFIADFQNERIRKVSNTAPVAPPTYLDEVLVYPNPTPGTFTIRSNVNDNLNIDLYDVTGRHILKKSFVGVGSIDATAWDNGMYTLTIKSDLGAVNKKLVVAH